MHLQLQFSLYWKNIVNKLQLISLIVSISLNSLLITIILLRSPKKFGIYKYLLCYIAVYEVIYSIFDYTVEPYFIAHGYAFTIFRVYEDSIFNKDQSYDLITITCGIFSSSLFFFAVHFVYRYSAVDRKFYNSYIRGIRILILFITPIVFGIVWTLICNVFFQTSSQSENYLRNKMLDIYDIPINLSSCMSVMYYTVDQTGATSPDLNIFIPMGFLYCLQIFTIFMVFYFAIRTYRMIKTVTRVNRMVSSVAKCIHLQVLQALVIQTSIPLLFLYIPFNCIFLLPMFNIDMGIGINFVTFSLAIFPAIDPLPMMFIIKSYREAMKEFLSICFGMSYKKNTVRRQDAITIE